MIYYQRFCCRIRIADTLMPGGPEIELLATEEGVDVRARRAQFAGARLNPLSDWFNASPSLLAHVRALRVGHHSSAGVNPGERLIDTATAMLYTGRARQVLYRWASEGRITRHGTPGVALWDVLELPGALAGGKPAPPPPLP